MNNIKLLPVILTVVFLYSCGSTGNRSSATSSAKVLPSFSVSTAAGNSFNLQNLKGKKVMVNLWASWCPPCRAEMPSIESLYQSIDTSKASIVLLSLDEQMENAVQFLQGSALSNRVFFPGESLPALFNVSGIPTTFFFNEKGELVHQIEGGSDYNTAAIKSLLN